MTLSELCGEEAPLKAGDLKTQGGKGLGLRGRRWKGLCVKRFDYVGRSRSFKIIRGLVSSEFGGLGVSGLKPFQVHGACISLATQTIGLSSVSAPLVLPHVIDSETILKDGYLAVNDYDEQIHA